MTRSVSKRVRTTLGTFALAASIAACASTGAVPQPFPMPGPSRGAAPAAPSGTEAADAVVSSALELRGAPYRDGGTDPSGFDCSGFTQYVFAEHGIALPRDVRQQFETGAEVAVNALQPGDLLFFSTTAPGPTHVGIAIDGDQFVHAPSSNGVVRVERLSTPYWSRRFIGARRIQESQ